MTNHHMHPFIDPEHDLSDSRVVEALAALAHMPHLQHLSELAQSLDRAHSQYHALMLLGLADGSECDDMRAEAERLDFYADKARKAIWC